MTLEIDVCIDDPGRADLGQERIDGVPSIDLGPTLPVTTGWTPMGPDRRPTITVEDSQERATSAPAPRVLRIPVLRLDRLRVEPAAGSLCPTSFSDNRYPGTFYPYVQYLSCEGISTGYQNGTFGVHRAITRGEVARFLYRSGQLHQQLIPSYGPEPVRELTRLTLQELGRTQTSLEHPVVWPSAFLMAGTEEQVAAHASQSMRRIGSPRTS